MSDEGWTTVSKKKSDDDKIHHNPIIYSPKINKQFYNENPSSTKESGNPPHISRGFTPNKQEKYCFKTTSSLPNLQSSNLQSSNLQSSNLQSSNLQSSNLQSQSFQQKNNYYKNQNFPYKNGNYHPRGGFPNSNFSNNNIKKKPFETSANIVKKPRPKRTPENIPDFNSPEEQEKFTQLKIEIPHLKMPGEIRREQLTINIDGLADKMLSDDCIELQRNGWEFMKVIKPDDESLLPEGDNYEIISIDNKWGDFLLFYKK